MLRALIAYDGSDCSKKAVRDLKRAGLPENAEATVLTVAENWMNPAIYADIMSNPYVPAEGCGDLFELSLEEARRTAQEAAEELRKYFPRWTVDAKAVADSAGGGVMQAIGERRPDFVVLGSHGRSAAARLLFGSVSQMVLTHAHCNLRVSRGRPENGAAPLRILVAYDGSQESETAFETVLRRNWPKGTAVRLVTVMDMRVSTAFLHPSGPMRYWISAEDKNSFTWIERMLSYQKKRIEEKGLIAYAEAIKGEPKRVLLKEAAEWGADSIFAGCRGLTGRERIIVGSVSTSLAMHAHCSVEVVHRLWDATACCDRIREEHRDCLAREAGVQTKT